MSQSFATPAAFQFSADPSSISAARVFCALVAFGDAATMGLMFIAPRAFSNGFALAIYLLLLILTGAFLGVLAIHPRAGERPRMFINLATLAAVVQTLFLIPFVSNAGIEHPGWLLISFRIALLALTLISLIIFGVAADRPATHQFLLQTAHRAVSIAIFAAVIKIGLTCWGRAFPWDIHLLPAIFALFVLAALTSQIAYHTARGPARTESASLFKTSAVFLLLTFFFLPQLVSTATSTTLHLLHVAGH